MFEQERCAYGHCHGKNFRSRKATFATGQFFRMILNRQILRKNNAKYQWRGLAQSVRWHWGKRPVPPNRCADAPGYSCMRAQITSMSCVPALLFASWIVRRVCAAGWGGDVVVLKFGMVFPVPFGAGAVFRRFMASHSYMMLKTPGRGMWYGKGCFSGIRSAE